MGTVFSHCILVEKTKPPFANPTYNLLTLCRYESKMIISSAGKVHISINISWDGGRNSIQGIEKPPKCSVPGYKRNSNRFINKFLVIVNVPRSDVKPR